MRRTRILATLGPVSDDAETLRALFDAGVDAVRLNFSHGTAAEHAETCSRVREISRAMGRQIAVLQDLSGPKIRIGRVTTPIDLADGGTLAIERGRFDGGPGRVSCSFDALFSSVGPGDRLLLDDGRIELEVTAAAADRLDTRVLAGGPLESHKGINVPTTAIKASALTEKDRDDLRAGIAMGVDLVALSFVQTADDVLAAREIATAAGVPDLPIVAKIEKPAAVEHIDEILAVADGLLVARGDLGIEMPLPQLPAVQKKLVMAARRAGVPVIVATQVLESMRHEPRPTRAEVTDAAHAVDEGADAIMLAGETAIGKYPVRAVAMLDAIVREAERAGSLGTSIAVAGSRFPEHGRALCEAAVALAKRANAHAIVALTRAGKTARSLAALRPAAPIFAATPSATTAARLALVWGVTPLLIADASAAAVRMSLLDHGAVPAGAVIVIVSVSPVLGQQETNFVHVERV